MMHIASSSGWLYSYRRLFKKVFEHFIDVTPLHGIFSSHSMPGPLLIFEKATN